MGILITRDGTITLPCALIILGIPLLTIGKHEHSKDQDANPNNDDDSTTTSTAHLLYTIETLSSLPFQYIAGIVLLSIAFLCILMELSLGGGFFSSTSTTASPRARRKKRSVRSKSGDRNFFQNGDDDDDDNEEEDYEETRLLARHYTRTEILKKLHDTCQEVVQQRYSSARTSSGDDHGGSGSGRGGGGGGGGGVTMKQQRNVIVYLNSLALQLRNHQDETRNLLKKDVGGVGNDSDGDGDGDGDALYLTCQEAAYHTLSTFHAIATTRTRSSSSVAKDDKDGNTTSSRDRDRDRNRNHDRVQSAAIALLALSAKHDKVRERNMHEADVYGLDLPIKIMQSSLHRIQQQQLQLHDVGNNHYDNDATTTATTCSDNREPAEIIAAELQRKACLYLGALADSVNTNAEDTNSASISTSPLSLSTIIAQEDGLQAILNAIDWFRYHSHVINWALWAIFQICYDHVSNQCLLVRLDGIQKICMVMDNVVNDWKKARDRDHNNNNKNDNGGALTAMRNEAKEVARHGIAILFDLLRYDEKKGDHNMMMTMNGNNKNKNKNKNNHIRTPQKDFMHIRRIALNAGMHTTVKNAMVAFDDNTEIMMMGQQMLIATGYRGDIPKFAGQIVPR